MQYNVHIYMNTCIYPCTHVHLHICHKLCYPNEQTTYAHITCIHLYYKAMDTHIKINTLSIVINTHIHMYT